MPKYYKHSETYLHVKNVENVEQLIHHLIMLNDKRFEPYRKLAREFLNDIANEIATDTEKISRLSPVAAKHVEVLQRSNEQLVKLIGMQQKNHKNVEFSEDDKNSLFDIILYLQ